MRLGIAIKAFFAALFDQQMAPQIERLLAGQPVSDSDTQPQAEPDAQRPRQPMQQPLSRDPAVTLLATLQREARLVDLVHEDLRQFSDAQVGAAARPCLQQCAGVLNRLFDLQPVVVGSEGDRVDVGGDASPMRYQWIGEGTAESGKLIHHGWQATKVELPQWAGEFADAKVVAPAQVQVP
jgi:hypothetical protein